MSIGESSSWSRCAASLVAAGVVAAWTPVGWAADPVLPNWEAAAQPWDRELGSHRVVARVVEPASAVRVVIPWRRRDTSPEQKAVLVRSLEDGVAVSNVVAVAVTAERGEILFEPATGAGDYAIYFLPVKIDGGAFPVSRYLAPQETADPVWKLAALATTSTAPVVRWQALSTQDAWNEMEVIATAEESKRVAERARDGMRIAFLEAGRSVRMFDRLPAALADEAAWSADGRVTAKPGGAAIFQVVVWAAGRDLADVTLEAGDGVTCLTTDGIDWLGQPFRRRVDVAAARVQPLWCVVEVPSSTPAGERRTTVRVRAAGVATQEISITVNVAAEGGPDDADPLGMNRLRWLNATTAIDDEPTRGYTPLAVKDRVIRCLGREVELGAHGLPVRLTSYFEPSITRISDQPQLQLLASPVEMHVITDAGETALTGNDLAFAEAKPGVVAWTSNWRGGGLEARLHGRMEFDGSLHFRVEVTADKTLAIRDIRLVIPRTEESSTYVLGLQHETGFTPPAWDWRWDVARRNQDAVWLGAVNGGLRVQLRADNYVRPGINIHYQRRPLHDPPSWSGGGLGGMTWSGHTLTCFSGPRLFEPSRPLHFDFDLLVTPFHPLRTAEQWKDRYFHTGGVPRETGKYLDNARASGATVVNIHQGNWLNPFINYPFVTADRLRDFAAAAHQRGMRAKYYYTVRELSNRAPEIFALRSMGDDVLLSGKGGGHPWAEEHLGGDYWQAWYEPSVQDVSVLTQPMCRFHNYYIEGLKWLCENAGCDGIYLDDIAYDRAIMLRARKVLDRYSPRGGLIDLHSWNEFHEGGAWAHCPNLFMDSLPFVDRLWFGEGHHYTGPPAEHFLVELSGIPFGLMGEMLEGGGNPWLGLVHGMTGRLGWQGDPRPIWRLWDEFGVKDSEFIGWWAGDHCPIRTNAADVKASAWIKQGATLVAVANFSGEARSVQLAIDWKTLGLDASRAKYFALAIPELRQRPALLDPAQPIMVRPHGGAVWILDENEHDVATPASAPALGESIFEDTFATTLDPSWHLVVSDRARDGAHIDAGYVFHVPANVHAFIERPVAEEAQAVSARIWQDGQDAGQQWGPGLALIWPNGSTLKTHVRQDGQLGVVVNGQESFPSSITVRAPVELSLRWDDQAVSVLAGGPAMGDLTEEIARFPRQRFPGAPTILRVGKFPGDTTAHDHGDPGPVGFNRIEWVRQHR